MMLAIQGSNAGKHAARLQRESVRAEDSRGDAHVPPSTFQRLPIRAVQVRITVKCLSERSLTLLSWNSTSMWMKLDGQSDGVSWCMCADDGATSPLHHGVAYVCNSVAQERHL